MKGQTDLKSMKMGSIGSKIKGKSIYFSEKLDQL